MKKRAITLSILILSTLSFSGGSIDPIEPTVEIPVLEEKTSDSSFYLGLGISSLKLKDDLTKESFKAKGVTLQAGYAYNNYLAIEGRYTHHIGDVEYNHGSDDRVNAGIDIDDYPTDFTNVAIYLKPQYKIYNFSAYALLGYGEVELTNIPQGDVDRAEAGFQWGLGASYTFLDAMTVFVDYVNMYDDKGFDYRAKNEDVKVDALTLGINYKF